MIIIDYELLIFSSEMIYFLLRSSIFLMKTRHSLIDVIFSDKIIRIYKIAKLWKKFEEKKTANKSNIINFSTKN